MTWANLNPLPRQKLLTSEQSRATSWTQSATAVETDRTSLTSAAKLMLFVAPVEKQVTSPLSAAPKGSPLRRINQVRKDLAKEAKDSAKDSKGPRRAQLSRVPRLQVVLRSAICVQKVTRPETAQTLKRSQRFTRVAKSSPRTTRRQLRRKRLQQKLPEKGKSGPAHPRMRQTPRQNSSPIGTNCAQPRRPDMLTGH